jgi:hypothetical protein
VGAGQAGMQMQTVYNSSATDRQFKINLNHDKSIIFKLKTEHNPPGAGKYLLFIIILKNKLFRL